MATEPREPCDLSPCTAEELEVYVGVVKVWYTRNCCLKAAQEIVFPVLQFLMDVLPEIEMQ